MLVRRLFGSTGWSCRCWVGQTVFGSCGQCGGRIGLLVVWSGQDSGDGALDGWMMGSQMLWPQWVYSHRRRENCQREGLLEVLRRV